MCNIKLCKQATAIQDKACMLIGSALTAVCATPWPLGGGGGLASLCETHVSISARCLKSRRPRLSEVVRCAVSAAPRWDNRTSRRTLPWRLTSQLKWDLDGRFSSLQGFAALGSASRHKRPWRSVFLVFSLKKKCFQGSFCLEAASPHEQHDEITQGGHTATRLIPHERSSAQRLQVVLASGRPEWGF